jgi:hypothetical protein
MSSASHIERTAQPWWQASLPTFANPPDRRAFYQTVASLRQLGYSERPEAQILEPFNVLVSFCLLVEALGLDKDKAGRFVRIFKLVHSMNEFGEKVPQEDRPLGTDLNLILDSFEDTVRLERIRQRLLPTKEKMLNPHQKEGYQLLQILEDERTSQLRGFDEQERALLAQLKSVRAARDEFGRQLTTLCPAWGQLKSARQTNLSSVERSALVQRYEGSVELKARFTVESYLATARANKVQASERGVYELFRRFRDESGVRTLVRRARDLAGGQAPPVVPAKAGQGDDPLDEIAP